MTDGQAARVLVCGSRGKSSIVRLLHAGLSTTDRQAHARITGVVPRELGPAGERELMRSAGGHVQEMRWWLQGLPVTAQSIVLENSAISPDLQDLAGRWLQPGLSLLCSTVPDHQEEWGPTRHDAATVLARGVPRGGRVILPDRLRGDEVLPDQLAARDCHVEYAAPLACDGPAHRSVNLGLAAAALERLGRATPAALDAMRRLPGDRYDFRVVQRGGAELALAFSANDPESSRALFASLGWAEGTTTLVYNHRADRPGRLRAFTGWLNRPGWDGVLLTGDRPPPGRLRSRHRRVADVRALLDGLPSGARVFGCGNIAGLPLELY